MLFTYDDPTFYLINLISFLSSQRVLGKLLNSTKSVIFGNQSGRARSQFGEGGVWGGEAGDSPTSVGYCPCIAGQCPQPCWWPSAGLAPACQHPPPPEGIRALCVFHIYLPGVNYFTWKILIAPVWMNYNLPAVLSQAL